MKIFEEWIHERQEQEEDFFVEVTLNYSKKTKEVEALINGISKLHEKIFPSIEGYKTLHITEEYKGNKLVEAHRNIKCGTNTQQWNTTF